MAASDAAPGAGEAGKPTVEYSTYTDESQLQEIIDLVSGDLSEPYSVFTYRYFINNWPQLCQLVRAAEIAPRNTAGKQCAPWNACRRKWTERWWE